ncbi:MAG: FAD-binding oxidoreductase [Anaerolineales bacterium]
MNTADVVIIGGGIIGASCAYFLSEKNLDVHLLERHFPASGTSRACDGLVLLWDKTPGAELALAKKSLNLWVQLNESLEADFGFERAGTILLAEEDAHLQAGQEKAEMIRRDGQRAEVLDSHTLRGLEPELAPDLAGGILFPDDLQIDPRRATLALLAASQENGLTLHTGTEVLEIKHAQSGDQSIFTIVTPGSEISTPIVICAAGVWSNGIAQMVGLELPIKPRKGHILVTARTPGFIHHPLLEGAYVSTVQSAADDLQVALVAEMTGTGTMLLGSSRQFAGDDRSVSIDVIQAIARRAGRFLPGLENIQVIRSYAGLRPWSPDHLPLIGPVQNIPGFYLATGHEGAGIGLAPVTGKLISDWVSDMAQSELADTFLPDRLLKT